MTSAVALALRKQLQARECLVGHKRECVVGRQSQHADLINRAGPRLEQPSLTLAKHACNQLLMSPALCCVAMLLCLT